MLSDPAQTRPREDRGDAHPTSPRRPHVSVTRSTSATSGRGRIKADHHGAYVAIDVDKGSWAVGDSILATADRMREQSPDAYDVWSIGVGFRALHHLGGRPLQKNRVIDGAVNAARSAMLDEEVKGAFAALADE